MKDNLLIWIVFGAIASAVVTLVDIWFELGWFYVY